MPKQIHRKIGEIHHVDVVNTSWDKMKAFLAELAGWALIGVIVIMIFD